MKPTSTYRMTKQTKRFLASFIDRHKRGEFKRMAIQGELAFIAAKFAKVDKSLKDQYNDI